MNDEIFYHAKKVATQESSIEIKHYTLVGNHDFIDEDDLPRTNESKALAKTIIANDRKKYMIKVGAYGRIFNPLGLHTEGKENKFLSKIGKNEWNFKEVNLKIFEMYLNFLKSRNIAWLNNAQRELI